MESSITQLCNAGFALAPVRGKIPAVGHWRETKVRLAIDVTKSISREAGHTGYMIVLGRDDVVLDIDPRNFPEGRQPHQELIQYLGIDIKRCVVTITGGGGLHIFFKLPEEGRDEYHRAVAVPGYPGVEVKRLGHYLVGAGSLHPDTGAEYVHQLGDFNDIPVAPEGLLELIRDGLTKEEIVDVDVTDDSDANVGRFLEYLEVHAETAVSGEHGDTTTYAVACVGKDYGLSFDKTLEVMLEVYNPKCQPPWTEEELRTKIENAYRYGKQGAGKMSALADFSALENAKSENPRLEYPGRWDYSPDGLVLTKTLNNTVNYLMLPDYKIGDILLNEFSGRCVITTSMPWHAEGSKVPTGGLEWTDSDTVQLRHYLSHRYRYDVPTPLIDTAVHATAMLWKFHPVRDWLNSLEWDGVPRLSTWLSETLDVRANPYSKRVSELTIMQAVARVFVPGIKADHVTILEGAQGIGKSRLIEAIAGGSQFFSDQFLDPHTKDSVDLMQGKWIIEMGEMEVFRRSDISALKAFVTRQTDRARLAYGRRSQDYPRQCVFIGTINPDSTGSYFTDMTGNRRFFPIACPNPIDVDKFKGMREQVFAEAVQVWKHKKKGHRLFIDDPKVAEIARTEQAAKLVDDPWQDAISKYLESLGSVDEVYIRCEEVYTEALGGSPFSLTNGVARRIGNVLRALGYYRTSKRIDGAVKKMWTRHIVEE